MDFSTGKLSLLDLLFLVGYALICLAIGLISSKRQKDEDYLIAGRKLGLIGFMASVVASYIGGAAIVAYSAYVYQFGISAIAVFLGTAIGFLVFIPYGLRLRKASYQQKYLTLSDWFYDRFDKKTGLLSALILFVVYLGMLVNQFIAGSSILAHISGWSYETALLFSSVVISVYLFAGGFSSVIKTDVFQYIVLFVLFLLFGFVLTDENRTQAVELLDFSRMDPAMTMAFIAFGIFIIFQSAEYWQRIYAASSDRVVKRGFVGSAVLVLITGVAISMIGMTAHSNVPGLDAKDAFAEGLQLLVPEKFIGAGLVLIFAAIMSSADTIIFVLASSVTEDYFTRLSGKSVSMRRQRNITRLFILVFSFLGFTFAWFFRDLVAVIVFITGMGFSIIPAAIASFHFKIHPVVAFSSMAGGLLYIVLLILNDTLVAEAAIASIVVSALVLLIGQQIKRCL